MDSSGASSSPFDSFKSKKVLRSSVNKPHSADDAPGAPAQSPWSSKTPEKPTQLPRRHLTRRQNLRSVNQVREAAKQIRTSDLKASVSSDPLTSPDAPTETPIAKGKTSKPLPEKYEILDEFFNSMVNSIRLLAKKGSPLTFTNISRRAESLTDSRFTYSHLAQIKFILPEGIEIKKILVRDEHTCFMKAELLVTLNFSSLQNDEPEAGSLQMRKLFRSRLVSFCKSNPEGCEVPEVELPEPFNQSSLVTPKAMEKPNLCSVQNTTFTISKPASHMPQSFKRRFSKQVSNHNVESVEQESLKLAPESQFLSVSNQVSDHSSIQAAPSPLKSCAKLPETPIKSFDLEKKRDHSFIDETPTKLTSTPFSATPAQPAQRLRCFMTPDQDSIKSPSKLTRRSSGKRSITFDTPVKNKTPPVKRVSSDDDDDLCDILHEDLFNSIKEKERKVLMESDPAISQAKRRKQMIAGLPKLFNTIHFYFQSINQSVITKQKLMHTILSSHLNIVDSGEVDEQLRLLQELAPEWIHQKITSSGDLLYCVNKTSNPESIYTRLTEAS